MLIPRNWKFGEHTTYGKGLFGRRSRQALEGENFHMQTGIYDLESVLHFCEFAFTIMI